MSFPWVVERPYWSYVVACVQRNWLLVCHAWFSSLTKQSECIILVVLILFVVGFSPRLVTLIRWMYNIIGNMCCNWFSHNCSFVSNSSFSIHIWHFFISLICRWNITFNFRHMWLKNRIPSVLCNRILAAKFSCATESLLVNFTYKKLKRRRRRPPRLFSCGLASCTKLGIVVVVTLWTNLGLMHELGWVGFKYPSCFPTNPFLFQISASFLRSVVVHLSLVVSLPQLYLLKLLSISEREKRGTPEKWITRSRFPVIGLRSLSVVVVFR